MAKLQENIIENIYTSILRFLGPLSLDETYKNIVDEAIRLVGGEYGSLVFKVNGEFVKIYSSAPEGYESKIRKRAYTYKAYTQNKAFIVNVSKTAKAHPELKKVGIRSTLFIPLSYKNQSIGVLIVNSKAMKDFGEKDRDVLKLFGSIASLAIRKSQLNDETERALKTRDIFISMAAHELRTPLTTINGYVALLISKIRSFDSITKSWVLDLDYEVKRLTGLVKELLEMNNIKSGKLNYRYKEANLVDVIDRSVKNIQIANRDKKIIFENKLSKVEIIVGDIDKLLEVFSNVLENAVKYSGENPDIKITLSEKNNNFRVVVRDKGIGIAQSDIGRIFEGFFRGNNHKREGLGIGLFLSKNIIEKHLGHLSIKSKINKGTEVEILLPERVIHQTGERVNGYVR